MWREARKTKAAVAAWASIVEDAQKRASYTSIRGHGGFVRAEWDEANEIVAAANAYTVKKHGPDRVAGFSPIPAMSMVSYAAGTRYLSLLGGTCLSFYDWYCDLPPSSPQTWGEQTDVAESADWYNAGFLILWGSNVPQTRTPDAHFYTEARYKGTKSAVVSPDYAEATKFADIWLQPQQGTDAALALAMGHVILKEYHLKRQVRYFADYARRYTDMPMLVRLTRKGDSYVPDRFVRASDFDSGLGESENAEWKTIGLDEVSGEAVTPHGTAGFRWDKRRGRWNLEEKDGKGRDIRLKLSQIEDGEAVPVAFPDFGSRAHSHFVRTEHAEILVRNVPASRVKLSEGEALVATVFDLLCANYGIDRGLGDENAASSYDQVPYGHELSRHHQHAGDVRRDRPVGRRLVALCWPGEAQAANRLAAARLRARLEQAAAADERHLLLLRAFRPVALRNPVGFRNPLAHRAGRRLVGQYDRLQCARRAHGLVAIGAAAQGESARSRGKSQGERTRAGRLCDVGAEIGRTGACLP
jgi:nitrate reductase alpha subunit